MSYCAPELQLVGRASAIVLGKPFGHGDNPVETTPTNEPSEMALGLDD